MKILHVIESLGRGGAENLLVALLPELRNMGVECHVAVLKEPYDLAPLLRKSGIIVHCFNMHYRRNYFSEFVRFIRLLKSEKYQVVHAHIFLAAAIVGVSRFFVREPWRVVSLHDLQYDSYPATTWLKRIRKKFDWFLNDKLMDARTAVSHAVRKHYEKELGMSDIEVFGNCVDVPVNVVSYDEARYQLQEKFGIVKDEFLIVMPGRLVHEKGHRYVFDALKVIKKNDFRPTLLILGNGGLARTLVEQTQLLGLQKIYFHDAVPHDELCLYMRGSDIVLMASTHEGWGMVAAEAMALGRCVLATTAGGLPEVVENNVTGILVPPADAPAIAEAIMKLMNDKSLRTQLGNAGEHWVRQNATPSVLAAKWRKYYAAKPPYL